MSNHVGYHEYHARGIHELRDRQQSGLEARRQELTRIYEREVRREVGNDPRFPRTFEEFASGDQYRLDYSQWMRDQQARMANVENRVLDYERSIQDYTHKGKNYLDLSCPMATRVVMEKQDFAKTRQLEKYTFLDHPKLTLSDPPKVVELQAVQEYSLLTESCAKEVARRQYELPAVLADTLSLVKREMSTLDARIDPRKIEDPNERQRFVDAARVDNFEEVTRKAEELLKDWTNLLDRAEPNINEMLTVLSRGTLENLHKLSINLWPGLVHDKAPNAAYRLPALTAMIGRQIGEQLYARAGQPTYERAMMRLAEVPIRIGANLDTSSWGKDRHAFQSQIDRWFNGIEKSLSSQGKQDFAKLAKEVKNHEFNDAFYVAQQALQTKDHGSITGVDAQVYRAAADLATRARELRALVENRIAGFNNSPVIALESFSAVLDTAIISIKDRLQVRAGESLNLH